MTPFQKQNRLVAACVFLFSLIIYLKTAAPTVSFWDCGEFIATSYILGIPHPPGAPLYTLLGRTMTMLPLPGEIAFRVNLMSVLSGAAATLLIYLCTVRLLSVWIDTTEKIGRLAALIGGAVAALSVAFSTSFWSNATEAEVYGFSMAFTLLAFWLALKWDDAHKDQTSDRILIFIAYLFGLGAGVHLQCLLTLPGILILVFTDLTEHRPFTTQLLLVLALIVYPFLAILVPVPILALMTLAILVGLISLRPAWRNPWFWVIGAAMAALGYSTYLALVVRSGLNPIIDMNNPENWETFKAFLSRQQYGTHSLFPRRGEPWAYQMNIHIKYFLQQFPFYFNTEGSFRRAIEVYGSGAYEIIQYSLIPFLLGIGGAVYHLRQDWKRFAAVFSMLAIMGVGLVLYLNMPDPEPREREYIFVGAYTFFGIWMGIGAAGLVVAAGRTQMPVPAAGLVSALLLMVPIGILDKNYFSHDRTGDYIAHDYAYNILQTCEKDAILFTNGDNDTYPLWFLQYVKGIRTDVRVTNLSLIKTPWYVKQIRDLEPTVPVNFTDAYIDNELTASIWDEPSDVHIAGITVKAADIPSAQYFVGDTNRRVQVLESHTLMIWRIVQQINWQRPIYFAVTVPTSNLAGLRPYLSMEGMAYRLVKTSALGQFEVDRTEHNLKNVYRYAGVADSTVYKDPVARRLLSNYLVLFEGLVRSKLMQGKYQDAFQTLQEAETLVPPYSLEDPQTWGLLGDRYRELALKFAENGQMDSAVLSMEELLRTTPETANRAQIEELIRAWKDLDAQPQNTPPDSAGPSPQQ